MKVLGIDPGKTLGWAILDVKDDEHSATLVASGNIDMSDWTDLEKLDLLIEDKAVLVSQVYIEVPREKWARHNIQALVDTAFIGGQVAGISHQLAKSWGVVEPKDWLLGVAKISRRGKKRPDKDEIWEAFFMWFPEARDMALYAVNPRTGKPRGIAEHSRDAALIALYGIRFRRWM